MKEKKGEVVEEERGEKEKKGVREREVRNGGREEGGGRERILTLFGMLI